MNNQSVAFIGLGVMGYPMAGHLAKAGYQVTVYNRTQSKAENWTKEYPGQMAATPAQAAAGADIVFTCVGNDEDLRSVVLGDEAILSSLSKHSIIVDHSTTSATVARELHQACQAQNNHFIDAPVSGGQQGAEKGALTIMCGADESSYEAVLPLLKCYAKAVTLMGPQGAGQLTKMCNQIAVAGVIQGLAESMSFAEQAGLDVAKVVEVMSAGAASSWQMVNRYQTMIKDDYNHGFAVDWMRKDLGICLAEAKQNQALLPVTELVDQFYADIQAMGGGRWDTSSLFKRLQAQKNKSNKNR